MQLRAWGAGIGDGQKSRERPICCPLSGRRATRGAAKRGVAEGCRDRARLIPGRHLEELCRGARFARRRATGEEEWRADGCRLIVHRIARRPPIVLTVLPIEGTRS